MSLTRRSILVYGLLAGIWVLVMAWQIEEHWRVAETAKTDLRSASKDIANTVGACIRASSFRQAVFEERLVSILGELVNGRENEPVRSRELLAIALLNSAGSNIVQVGPAIDTAVLQEGEHWGNHEVTFVTPVNLGTNLLVLLPPRHEMTNASGVAPSASGQGSGPPLPPPHDAEPGHDPDSHPHAGGPHGHRDWPPWLHLSPEEKEKQGLAGLVLAMSTSTFEAACTHDLWLRAMICLLATLSAAGSALAWRNVVKSADLQIRLVRASELNTHLKEMNLAAAGLAHETRNPLNIIRGLAQIISKQPQAGLEAQAKSKQIIEEADKVAAQLNEFINYSRPREVHRRPLALSSVVNEVVRTLSYDLQEKGIRLDIRGEVFNIEADEQLLRQAVFNLVLNAIQAVNGNGEIQVVTQRAGASEAALEVRDNGPGVPPERRTEIFKPYFTTQKEGTGLGLAVVQQIVLAHGWEITCLPNEPKGAIFRLTHLKLV